jgi:hypothetical protein
MRISAPHFVAGLVFDPDNIRVIRAAPILRYMLGWTVARVRSYCLTRNWKIEP